MDFKYSKYWNQESKLTRLIGQPIIHKKLEILAEQVMNNQPVSILLNARTGLGKTTFGNFFIQSCQEKGEIEYTEWIPTDTNQDISDFLNIHPDIKIVFIDECHLLKDPEWLYAFLDRKERTFILATNELGKLKSPLKNGRLLTLTFEEYSQMDLMLMAYYSLNKEYKSMDKGYFQKIVKAAKNNPRRIVHSICKQFNTFGDIVTKGKGIQQTTQFNEIMEFIGYDEKGYDAQERVYLKFLKTVGKVGLNTIVSATGLSRETIVNDIEPDLLACGIITVSSGGRIYVGEK